MQKKLQDFIDKALFRGDSINDIEKEIKRLSSDILRSIDNAIYFAVVLASGYMNDIGDSYIKSAAAVRGKAYSNELHESWNNNVQDSVRAYVWDKEYPDGKTLNDRTQRLAIVAALTVLNASNNSKYANLPLKELQGKIAIDMQNVGKAIFRVVSNSSSNAYHATTAEMASRMSFVEGVRIKRAVYGKGSSDCMICEEHGGSVGGEGKTYFKDEFGGRSTDLWLMANAPSYHPHCNCGVTFMMMPISEWVFGGVK